MYLNARVLKIGLLNLACLVMASACGMNLSPEEYVAKAKELMAKGDMKAASIELTNAIQENPNLVEGRWLLAQAALEAGDGAKAEKEAIKAKELGQPITDIQPLLAKALLLQGNLDGVLKQTETIQGHPTAKEKASILGVRGQALVAGGKADQAIKVLDQALQSEPNSLEAMIGMTALHGYQRQFEEARKYAALAQKAHPNSPDVWSGQGDLEMVRGDVAKAEEAFGKAITLRRYVGLDYAKRALMRIQLKRYDEAAGDLEQLAKQGYGQQPYVAYVTGLLHFMRGNFPQAKQAFEASYAANPNFQPTRLYLAATYNQLGEQENALKHAEWLLGQSPRSPSVKSLLGAIRISRGEFVPAKKLLHEALASTPNDLQVLRMLAGVAQMEGNTAQALEYAGRIAELAPDSEEAQAGLLVARMFAGQSLDSPLPTNAKAKVDPYTVEFLRAYQAMRDKQPAKAIELAGKLQARHPDRVEPLNLMAAAYLMLGQGDKARQLLEKALKIKPNEPSASRNLAKLEAHSGNDKRARDLLLPLVKAYPGDDEAVLLLAALETRLGNQGAVAPMLEQAIQHNPNALGVRTMLAATYLHAGKLQQVLSLTDKLSEAQLKRQPTLLELRGKALMRAGDALPASKTFEQWTKLAPGSAAAQFYLGDSLARTGQGQAARKALEQSLKLGPRYLPARVGEIKLLVQLNRLDAARKALTKLRQDFGERPEVLGIEGWFALGTGDFANAERALAAALARNPDSELAILLARARWGQKKHDVSLAGMRDWLKSHPDDLPMLLHLAGAYLSLNRNEEARQAYAQVVAKYPNHVPALNNLAWLGQDKDLNQSIQHARHALTLAPNDPYVKDTLGMLTWKRGDTKEAQEFLTEAARLAPKDPQIQLHLGQLLAKQGRNAEARKALQTLITNAANAPQAKEAKALLDTLGR